MNLVIISHKTCWPDTDAQGRYKTDGGFPLQVAAISELFEKTELAVPCKNEPAAFGLSRIEGNRISVIPLAAPSGHGLSRKLHMIRWLISNGVAVWQAVRRADAVHTPIPGDVGSIGMLFALLQRKPLFVRHCGNWLAPRTNAERLWKRSMIFFAGGRNVMMATGGMPTPPSERNPNVKWIFSTSLSRRQIEASQARTLPRDGAIKLVIACRQEERKGTDIVLDSLPLILQTFPKASLDVIGDGSLLPVLKAQTSALGLDSRVTFHGKLAQGDVVEKLKHAHVFCYPTSASEGFPKVVLEALASGLPIATTGVSVLPQLLATNCGKLIDRPDAKQLALAVGEICSDETRYSELSQNALQTARQYSLENWRDLIGATLCEAWNVASLAGPIRHDLTAAAS